ncbi:MAG: hypothetical protein LUG89_00385, partial [Methanosphaera sp.]|nr:hypothetical protein [Methanosphaera sp.]
ILYYMNTRGIINLEFITTILVLLIIITLTISLATIQLENMEQTQNRADARILLDSLANVIDNTYTSGDGYVTTYTMPSTINTESYIVKINSTAIYVNSHYQIASNDYLSKNSLGSKNYILLPSYVYEFKNINNTVYINQLT